MTSIRQAMVVEDQPALAQWLVQTLEEAFPGVHVVYAGTLQAARLVLKELATPEIALIDLGLPDGSGVDLIREIAAAHPNCQCVVSTIYADDQHLFPALRAGAGGYLLKDQPRERIVQSLRGIAAGEPPLSASIARRLLRVFGDAAPTAAEGGETLTPRERETLALIAKGFKIAEVATSLGVTRNTAHGFIKNVYRKLKIGSRAEAATEAARMGLINPHL
jgi:DNA-binding NarL/FixJ family response regulator